MLRNPGRWNGFVAGLLFLSIPGAQAQVVVEVGQNFSGTSSGNSSTNSLAFPADCDGAIGPNYFVEFINGSFSVYAKTNGRRVLRMTDVDFWANAGVGVNVGEFWDVTDPRIIYDPSVQRWFASQVDLDLFSFIFDDSLAPNHFLLAVSTSADPRDPWNGISFDADPDGGNFADFPTLGLDDHGVYLSGDLFDPNNFPVGPTLVSFPKADLLPDPPAFTNRTSFGVMSYGDRGQVLQPAVCFDGGSSGCVLAASDIGNDSNPHSGLDFFSVQNPDLAAASLSPVTIIDTSPWVVPNNPIVGAPMFTPMQPDGTATLQANDARFASLIYSVGGVLYAVHNTEVSGRIAIRWYRIRAADATLMESGTVADPELDLLFPSIAANADGTVVIACNGSSIDTPVSCYAIAGHTVDNVTTFGAPVLLQSGVGSYHDDYEAAGLADTSRWGDYSSLSVDPTDPNKFWAIQMYPSDFDAWSTQISEVRTCFPKLSIACSGTNAVISWPGTAVAFNLETNTNLKATNSWTVVSQGFSTNSGQILVAVPLSIGAKFFRLHKP